MAGSSDNKHWPDLGTGDCEQTRNTPPTRSELRKFLLSMDGVYARMLRRLAGHEPGKGW